MKINKSLILISLICLILLPSCQDLKEGLSGQKKKSGKKTGEGKRGKGERRSVARETPSCTRTHSFQRQWFVEFDFGIETHLW